MWCTLTPRVDRAADAIALTLEMTSVLTTLLEKIFGKDKQRLLFLGLDASGRTTALYQLKLGEVVTTIPTIGFVRVAGFEPRLLHLAPPALAIRARAVSMGKSYFPTLLHDSWLVTEC